MIKVLIADDQELIRQSLSIVLDNQEGIEVIGTAANGREVIRAVREQVPDVILMDIRMPVMDGVQCTQILKDNNIKSKIIILTTFDDDEYVFNALKEGASGYLLKGISVDKLVDAIKQVYAGTAMINPDIISKVVKIFTHMAQGNMMIQVENGCVSEIGNTEWKVIRMVGQGYSNKEIAAGLFLSEGTVRNYLSSILSKLSLRDRTQLAIWAVQTGAVNKILDEDV